MNLMDDVDASCAICGAPPDPECPHEGESLHLALSQAHLRWGALDRINDWVLNHARNQIVLTFNSMKAVRLEAHKAYLSRLPCYSLYIQYNGRPPLQRNVLAQLHSQIQQAEYIFKRGIDEDWKRSCMMYPTVLDYYFSLVEVRFPSEKDERMVEPRFAGAVPKQKRLKERRGSVETGGRSRRKERRGSRGRTPPAMPRAPMPGEFGRYGR